MKIKPFSPRRRNVVAALLIVAVAGLTMSVTVTPWLGTALYVVAIAVLFVMAW